MSVSLDANLRLSQEMAYSAKQDGLLGRADTPSMSGGKADDKEQIKKIAEDFEALFLDLVLKSMRETIQKSGLIDGGNAEDIYRSMLDSEYSKMMSAQRQTGLADSIEKFLLQSQGNEAPPAQADLAQGTAQGGGAAETSAPDMLDVLKVNAIKAYKAQGLPVGQKQETMDGVPKLGPI